MEVLERLQDVIDFPNFQIFQSTLAKLIFYFTNFELTLESWLFDFTKVGSNLSKLTCAALVELLGQKKQRGRFPLWLCKTQEAVKMLLINWKQPYPGPKLSLEYSTLLTLNALIQLYQLWINFGKLTFWLSQSWE